MQLGFALGLTEVALKAAVVGERLESAELRQIGNPVLADCVGDHVRKGRVGQQQPPPRRDAVGLVGESLGKNLGEVFDRRLAQQLRMNRGDAVGAVRADDGQIGHANFALRRLLR